MKTSNEGQKFRARLCVDLNYQTTSGLTKAFGCKNKVFGTLSDLTLDLWCKKLKMLQGLRKRIQDRLGCVHEMP